MMGEAKRRGTKAERVAAAVARKAVEDSFMEQWRAQERERRAKARIALKLAEREAGIATRSGFITPALVAAMSAMMSPAQHLPALRARAK